MNKTILKNFSFGFEIEGNFAQSLQSKITGEWKEDGSVGSDERIRLPNDFTPINLGEGESDDCSHCEGSGEFYEDCNCDYDINRCVHIHSPSCGHRSLTSPSYDNCAHECGDECYMRPCDETDNYHLTECENCSGSGHSSESAGLAQEYASGKFASLEDMLKELAKFNSGNKKPNHIWNRTCGLHIHIGKKPSNKLSYKQIWNLAANLDFLRQLYDEAANWCDCQRKRLYDDDNHYYKFWDNPKQLIKTYQRQYPERSFERGTDSEKFRFLRFHDEFKTLEFRFLSPCQHKVENVEKLIDNLTEYLGADFNYQKQTKITDEPQKEVLYIPLPVEKKQYNLISAPHLPFGTEFAERVI